MIGITDITMICAENLNASEEARQRSVTSPHVAINAAIAAWSELDCDRLHSKIRCPNKPSQSNCNTGFLVAQT
ncbi:MAG: hypothetical protein MUF49_30690 [Oculatellaceae cyanobacterium Prado106]|nr:hypothetical protein [Oculatellaceae cyanobacterium Prado106]